MTRVLGFLVRNWPLKLAALILATVLYAGLVLSQNARYWPGQVPIQVFNQPPTAFILGDLADVHDIRYFAPADAADRLSSAAFTAWIDLKDVIPDPSTGLVTVPVHLLVSDTRVTILDYTPQAGDGPPRPDRAPDRARHASAMAPCRRDSRWGEPELSQTTVVASGPESVVEQIVSAEARVRIQSSGIDVDQLVDLVAVDGRDEVLSPVDLNPSSIRVSIPVGNPVTTKTVPVAAVVTGTPGDGFEVAGTTLDPDVATISGDAVTLATLTSVSTLPVSIEGATATRHADRRARPRRGADRRREPDRERDRRASRERRDPQLLGRARRRRGGAGPDVHGRRRQRRGDARWRTSRPSTTWMPRPSSPRSAWPAWPTGSRR